MTVPDPRAAAAVAAIGAAVTAQQAAVPESSQTTATLLALAATVQLAINACNTLAATVVNSSLPADVALYLWATGAVGTLQTYLSTLNDLSGQGDSIVIEESGTDLFTIAATQLGDWTRWADLAAINDITDPFITTQTAISIPKN